MHGPYDVDACGRLEEPELRADPWVEVEELVLLVAAVEAPVQVHDAAEPEAPAQVLRLCGEGLVAHDPGVARHPGPRRPGPVLHAGEGHRAVRGGVAVGVEDPVLGDLPGDVLLEHHGRRLGPGRGEGHEGLGRPHDRADVHRRGAQPAERIDVLRHDGERHPRRERCDLLKRRREDRPRHRDPELDARVVQPALAREPARESRRDLGGDEPRRQIVGVLGHEHRGLVVGRQRNRGMTELLADAREDLEQSGLVLEPARRRHEPTPEIARDRRRGQAILGHRVHGHARASEGSDCSDAAVVKRVPPDLHDEQWNASVEADHILACQRELHPWVSPVPPTGLRTGARPRPQLGRPHCCTLRPNGVEADESRARRA